MPIPPQATLYDKKGIPIAVDPRIPGLTRVTPKPPQDRCSRNTPPDQVSSDFNRNIFSITANAKRTASDEPQDDLGKRVKSDHKPFALESPVTITAPPPTPVSASPPTFTRATAGDFMAECVTNGMLSTPAETVPARSTPLKGPPWPLEAIETLTQVSADLLLALVRKGADDRERQLQIAVGTLRTCLDVDFIPHMDAWKADAEARKYQQTTPLSAILASFKPHLSISIPQVSTPTAKSPNEPESTAPVAFGVPPSREAIRKQLASARATIEKQAQDLKTKDDEIARAEEENKRVNARLSQMSTPPEAAKSAVPAKPASTAELATLHRINKDHIEKLNNQKSQINGLLAQNASLKEKLKSAGVSAGRTNGDRHDGQTRDAGGSDHGARYEPTRKESWEKQSPRLEPNRRHGGASNTLATPAIEHDYRAASDTSERNGDYSSFAGYGKRNSNTYDSRSQCERSTQSTPKEVPYVPTGPRAPQVRLQSTYMSRPHIDHQYTSTNGWGDYYLKDGFGGMQADRLDLE